MTTTRRRLRLRTSSGRRTIGGGASAPGARSSGGHATVGDLPSPGGEASRSASGESQAPRGRLWLEHPFAVPSLYLIVIAVAEIATSVEARRGLPLHVGILLVLLVHGAVVADERWRALVWSLAIVPVIRVSSLTLPLAGIPTVYWHALIGMPIFAATIAAARTLGYSRQDLGLVLARRHLPFDLLMLPVGVAIGLGEYLILLPEPLSRTGSLADIWLPALILTICTGLEEELAFRGLLHRAATDVMGGGAAMVFVSLLFMSLHIGYQSLTHLALVFGVGWLFAVLRERSGSILGPSLGHAGVNVSALLIWPFAVPVLLGLR